MQEQKEGENSNNHSLNEKKVKMNEQALKKQMRMIKMKKELYKFFYFSWLLFSENLFAIYVFILESFMTIYVIF